MAELVYAHDSKSCSERSVGSTPTPGTTMEALFKKVDYSTALAYLIGASIGDGNLSNPNGRAIRLRITCDTQYQTVIHNIEEALKVVVPKNKIGFVPKGRSCIDISCYSNKWEALLGWKADLGPKPEQNIRIPQWIFSNPQFVRHCLKGLFETDGSVYLDRSYITCNFVTTIKSILGDVEELVTVLGYRPNIQKKEYLNKRTKYTLRISRKASNFVKEINLSKYSFDYSK